MIAAAIVGLGRWGQTLVAAVQGKSDRLRFTTAVSRDPARMPRLHDRHGLRRSSTASTRRSPIRRIDAVVLATPHTQHADQVIAAADAGKAVFCEKPLALTRAEAERAVAACREAGIVLGVGTDKRFFPALHGAGAHRRRAANWGRLLHIEAQFQQRGGGTVFAAVARFVRGDRRPAA